MPRRLRPASKGVDRAEDVAVAKIVGNVDIAFLTHAGRRMSEHVCDSGDGDVVVSVDPRGVSIAQATLSRLALPALLVLVLAAVAARHWRKHDV